MTKKKGLIISRQIGAARAFSAWLQEADVQDRYELDVLFYPPSEPAFKNITDAKRIETFVTPKPIYDFVFSGTSLEAQEDARYFRWARQHSIPSIAFVDQWINYRERFATEEMPDAIFCVDETAAESLRTFFPQISIYATGSPALNYLRDFWKHHHREVKPDVVYFVTEPTNSEYEKTHGISDLAMLDKLISHLESQKEPRKQKLQVLLHPTDSVQRLHLYRKHIEIVTGGKEQMFCEAALVVGMRSFLLLESSLLGIPVLSLQVGRKTTSDLTDHRAGITVATSTEEITLYGISANTNPILQPHTWTDTLNRICR